VLKAAVVVLVDTQTHEQTARVGNALATAHEFKEAGDEVDLIFTWAGTKWIGELSNPDYWLHRAFNIVKNEVARACWACAVAFGVKKEVEASGIALLAEYKGHQSLRERVPQGYQVITS